MVPAMFDLLMEESMAKNAKQFMRCACCGNQFPVVEGRVQQWRVGNEYARNEFCAEGGSSCAGSPRTNRKSPIGPESGPPQVGAA
jgi:hypothetical protein